MQPRDGQKVSYIGLGEEGLSLGDKGTVIAAGVSGSHVSWGSGQRIGSITLTDNEDIAVSSASRTAVDESLDESLEFGAMAVTAMRDVFDSEGETGVLNAMNEQGHLASLASVAEDAITMVAAQIRASASFEMVLGQLEPEEADAIVTAAAAVLLRDALGE